MKGLKKGLMKGLPHRLFLALVVVVPGIADSWRDGALPALEPYFQNFRTESLFIVLIRPPDGVATSLSPYFPKATFKTVMDWGQAEVHGADLLVDWSTEAHPRRDVLRRAFSSRGGLLKGGLLVQMHPDSSEILR